MEVNIYWERAHFFSGACGCGCGYGCGKSIDGSARILSSHRLLFTYPQLTPEQLRGVVLARFLAVEQGRDAAQGGGKKEHAAAEEHGDPQPARAVEDGGGEEGAYDEGDGSELEQPVEGPVGLVEERARRGRDEGVLGRRGYGSVRESVRRG